MKILLLLPGKIKPKPLAAAEGEYKNRLKNFGVDFIEYRDEKIIPNNPSLTKQAEAKRIFQFLKPKDFLVVCDERGKSVSTQHLVDFVQASQMGTHPLAGKQRLVIVVGGALGLDEKIRARADAVWALSSLVMAGGIARLVLLEGLYRAFTIVQNHPYHNT